MLKVYPMVLGPVQTMCYVISHQNQAVVVDPAASGKKIYDYLQSQNLTLEAILITHGHFDHIGGVNELVARCHVPVYAHKKEQEYFNKPEVNLSTMVYEHLVLDDQIDFHYVADYQTLSLLGQAVKVFHVPGHTTGSLCYYFEDDQIVFTGDTLFEGAIGRTDFIYGNHEQLVTMLKQKIMTLPPQTLVYPGHGACTTVETEAKQNMFLR